MAGGTKGLGAGDIPALLHANPLVEVSVPDAQLLSNVQSTLALGLPEVRQFPAHDRVLAVAAGGPSLETTYSDLIGHDIVAVNGSLSFLLERDITPWACGVLDPGPHMVDIVRREPDVTYFVASTCAPELFHHLSGCRVIVWHPAGLPGLGAHLPRDKLMIGGGSTMGLRWINLGWVFGYRHFEMHGLDSSYRGDATHAYADRRDGQRKDRITVMGRETSLNFLHQVGDFMQIMPLFDDCQINVHGEGLLQDVWNEHRHGQP